MTDFEYKMVFVVRSDLRLGAGKLAAQVGHAAVGLTLANQKRKRETFDRWLKDGQKKIVVKVAGLKELLRLKSEAELRGLPTSLVDDAGHTQVEPGTTTCLGIGPARNEDIDPLTGELPLA